MSNSYMWAQTACDIPDTPYERKQSGSQQQSSQMPRSYQPESYNGHDSQSSYGQAPASPPSYGTQSRSSSYTHNQQQPSQYQQQQSSPSQYQQQQQPSRQSSYTHSSSNGGHSGGNSDFIEQAVSMQDLIRENFGGQGSSSGSLQLSPAMLEHLQNVPQRGGDSKLYFLEPQSGGKSMSSMMYPSSDLALVNQLAVKHHRHACMGILDGSGPEQNEKVLRGTEWSLLNDERIEITTQVTVGGGQRVTVNTTVQELSLFRRK